MRSHFIGEISMQEGNSEYVLQNCRLLLTLLLVLTFILSKKIMIFQTWVHQFNLWKPSSIQKHYQLFFPESLLPLPSGQQISNPAKFWWWVWIKISDFWWNSAWVADTLQLINPSPWCSTSAHLIVFLGSITSRCLGKEPELLPLRFLGTEDQTQESDGNWA